MAVFSSSTRGRQGRILHFFDGLQRSTIKASAARISTSAVHPILSQPSGTPCPVLFTFFVNWAGYLSRRPAADPTMAKIASPHTQRNTDRQKKVAGKKTPKREKVLGPEGSRYEVNQLDEALRRRLMANEGKMQSRSRCRGVPCLRAAPQSPLPAISRPA
jgi:hypothetical protein